MRSSASPSTIGSTNSSVSPRRSSPRPRRDADVARSPTPSTSAARAQLGALVAVVAIHRVEASRSPSRCGHRAVLHSSLELLEQVGGLVRRDVAAVRERVHRDARDAARRARHGRSRAGDRRASARRRPRRDRPGAARRDPHARPSKAARRRGSRRGCRRRPPSRSRTRSCGDDAAGADVEVPDLGVAHLALGKADAGPDAVSVVCGIAPRAASKTGVCASATALPGPGARHRSRRGSTSATGAESSTRRAPRGAIAREARGRGSRRRRARRRRRAARAARRALSGLTEPP